MFCHFCLHASYGELCSQTPEEDGAYLDLRQENEDLLRRLAEVQQQMWTLEEKVKLLVAKYIIYYEGHTQGTLKTTTTKVKREIAD